MTQRAEGDGYYDRLRKERRELSKESSAIFDGRKTLRVAFQAASGREKEELEQRLEASWQAYENIRQKQEALDEKERNPPWIELSKNLLYADYKKVEELSRDGKLIALMNEERVSILRQPAYAGDEKIAKLMIERGADLNMPGGELKEPPVLTAIYKDNANIFKMLVNAGAKLDARAARELAEKFHATKVLGVLDSLDRKAKKPAAPKKAAG